MNRTYIGLLFLQLLLFGCKESKEELNLFVWAEYLSPEALSMFEKENNCRIVVDTFDSNEAMYAKLKLGVTGYDVIMPSNYIFDLLVKQEMLWEVPFDTFSNKMFFQEEKVSELGLGSTTYGLPFLVSYTGIGYRPNRVEDFDSSWSVFGRHSLRGRMTMLNDVREVLGAALITLGLDVNTKNPDEIEKAVQLVLKWKKNIAKFESEQYKNGLASAEYLVSQGFNVDVLQVMLDEEDVSFVFPKEGSLYSVDYVAILKTAPHKELAEKFLNFLLKPDIAALNMNFSFTVGFVKVDEDLILPLLKEKEFLFPTPEIQKRSRLLKSIDGAEELYSAAWERILSD